MADIPGEKGLSANKDIQPSEYKCSVIYIIVFVLAVPCWDDSFILVIS